MQIMKTLFISRVLIPAIVMMLPGFVCATPLALVAADANPAPVQTAANAPNTVHAVNPAAMTSSTSLDATRGDYRLAGGDAIRISVFQKPELTLETRVAEGGDITFPLIGRLNVRGMTIDEGASAIAAELQKGDLVKNAQVNIALLQIRGNQVSVLGQVNHPGRIPLETFDMRVSDVLAAAGGIINAANAPAVSGSGADTVIVVGTRDGKPFRREIDIPSLFVGNHPADDIVVAGGDTIYVPPAHIYYIYGEVQRPGAYVLTRGMTVRQALAQAGGPTQRGTERGLHVDRPSADGAAHASTPAMNDLVQTNDVLYVPESLF